MTLMVTIRRWVLALVAAMLFVSIFSVASPALAAQAKRKPAAVNPVAKT